MNVQSTNAGGCDVALEHATNILLMISILHDILYTILLKPPLFWYTLVFEVRQGSHHQPYHQQFSQKQRPEGWTERGVGPH